MNHKSLAPSSISELLCGSTSIWMTNLEGGGGKIYRPWSLLTWHYVNFPESLNRGGIIYLPGLSQHSSVLISWDVGEQSETCHSESKWSIMCICFVLLNVCHLELRPARLTRFGYLRLIRDHICLFARQEDSLIFLTSKQPKENLNSTSFFFHDLHYKLYYVWLCVCLLCSIHAHSRQAAKELNICNYEAIKLETRKCATRWWKYVELLEGKGSDRQ